MSQNHWRLDLLLLQQGGLCLSLGEQCPFHINHSGVINLCLFSVMQKKKGYRRKKNNGGTALIGMKPCSHGPFGTLP